MAESKSASVVFTNGSLLAKNAQAAAGSAKSAADNAYNLAYSAQKTADGKNSIYRGSDPNTVPTAGLKEGDIYFTDNTLWTWNGSTWEKTVSDTTGAEIHAKVEKAMAESQKSVAELKSDVEAKVKKLDDEIAQTEIKTGNALNFYKEQYYLSSSYTELVGGSWSDEVPPRKVEGKYVWSRYVTANIGDPTNQQYSDPVCISGLDGDTGPQGPQGVPGPKGADGRTTYVHVAYANSADGKSNFNTSYFNDALYIGVLTDYTQTDSNDYTKYTWSRLKGDAGDQGVPGPKGADGRTTYVHFAYADSSDGTINFDVSNSDGKLYIGQYTDYTQADSTNPASYKWTKIKGETGPTGATGPKGDTGDTGFFIGTTPPPNPAKGTVWATNDSSGHMNSAKKWDGSNWVSTAFTQDLVAGNISATKIVGGELDVNKITIKNAQNMPINSTVSLGKKLSDIEQDANGLTATVMGGGNLLNNTSDTLQSVTANNWVWYATSVDEPVAKHQVDGQTVTLSAWIENPSKEAWVQMLTNTGGVHGNRIPAGGKGWSQVTFTMPSGFSLWNIVVGCGDGSGAITLSYSSLQLELGPNRTAWSQSTADIAQLKITANSLNAYVKGSRGSETLKALLSMDPNNSTIGQVVNNHLVAGINMSSDGDLKIVGNKLHITADTKIENAVIKSAMIDSVDASKITTGELDAAKIRVINLDADSITTGSFRAALYRLSDFTNYTVSPSSPWDFNQTKTNGKWFLNGESTGEHVYNGPMVPNGPDDKVGHKLAPWMYVTCQVNSDGSRVTVTVWRDDDPTQYQRTWVGDHWTPWVMLPNSQNLVSAINLSPDSVKISGKNIELDGNTRIADGFTLSADKIISGTLNGVTITGSKFIANTQNGNLFDKLWDNYQVTVENTGIDITGSYTIGNTQTDVTTSLTGGDLYIERFEHDPEDASPNEWKKFIDINTDGPAPYIKLVNEGPGAGKYASTYVGSDAVQSDIGSFGKWNFNGYKARADSSLYIANSNGTNFDGHGDVGFQVWSGIGLGQNTIYMPGNDLYVQQGNCGPGLGARYSNSGKVQIHCEKIISQVANTVSSRLSVKTDITPVTYDRALAAVEGTEMYDYRYVSDDSGQHYVSGIIDDVNPDPQYHMDDMLINKERTARIDANLVGYHHVVLQELLKKIDELQAELTELKSKEN